jgi:hypothetical protein
LISGITLLIAVSSTTTPSRPFLISVFVMLKVLMVFQSIFQGLLLGSVVMPWAIFFALFSISSQSRENFDFAWV